MSLQQAAFILEGKTPVESSTGDGGGGGGEGGDVGSVGSGPAAPSLVRAELPGPWQSESLLAESWSTVGDVDPEDIKSLDSGDGAALTGEENHSSNSDMVHLEEDEAEMLEEPDEEEEEDDGLQTSVLSLIGDERELAELREGETEEELHAPRTEDLLVSAEERRVGREPPEFMQVVPPMALPPLPIVRLDPPAATSTPAPSTAAPEAEEVYSTQGLHPPPILAAAESVLESSEQSQSSQSSAEGPQAAPEEPQSTALPETEPLGATELLCGGAVLVAIVGMVAYGAVAYCRK